MALRIITDSASDLPKQFGQYFGIPIIPTPVIIDGTDYFDGETVMSSEFYNILKSGAAISTYHVNTYMFLQHFEPFARSGDDLIYICFSTGIAGTMNAARQAKEELLERYPDFDLTIIDSKSASIGFGLSVLYAGLMLKRGASKEEIIEATEYHCKHMNHVFTVETLEYLMKGGRIGKASAVAGEMLSIKPIIQVNKEGALHVTEKVRGRKKSLHRIVQCVGEQGEELDKQVIGVCHGDDKPTLDMVKDMLRDSYGVKYVLENYVGCAIGAHTGPGIIGITFLDTSSPYIREEDLSELSLVI